MKRTAWFGLVGLVICILAGCAGAGGNKAENDYPAAGKALRANGYSRFEDESGVSVNQRWFMAQQAAKLDAYRGLADLLYREALDERNTVGSQVMRDEVYRIYFDTYLRGARAVDYRTVKDTLKATLELNLTPRFYRCMSGDAAAVNRCLEDDNKLPFTRIGYKPATMASVNAACGNRDCSDQLYVKGFSGERNPVDDVLLDAGLYDTEWAIHTGANVFGRYLLFKGFINGL